MLIGVIYIFADWVTFELVLLEVLLDSMLPVKFFKRVVIQDGLYDILIIYLEVIDIDPI